MNWILLTFLAVIARATYSLGTKMLSSDVKVSPITQSFLLTTASGVLALLISPFIGGISFSGVFSYVWLVVLLVAASVFGNIIYFVGQKKLDAGTTQVAFSSILIWGAVLAVLFLNTKFSLYQFFGIIIMLCAILLVQYKKTSLVFNFSILYIVISAMLFAVMQIVSAALSTSINTGAYLILSYLGTALVIFLLYFKKITADYKKLISQIKGTFWTTLFASGTSLLYFVFSYMAYKQAPDRGVVVVLLTSQVVLSVLFGILFLKERENMPKKLLACVLAFIASVLIKSY